MLVLGIETSCDETSAAVVNGEKRILSNIVYSQILKHQPFGGIVPEIAARSHVEKLDEVIELATNKANIQLNDLDGIAVTAGPGLIGGVIVGLITAKAISAALNIPLIGINHLEGHALAARLTNQIDFPYLLVLASGGHTQILEVSDIGKYNIISNTVDDACGECFDKVAKMLSLGFPGGPEIEIAAAKGNKHKFSLPRPMTNKNELNFSFAGLKTAVMLKISKLDNTSLNKEIVYDMAASFQNAVADIFCDRLEKSIKIFSMRYNSESIVFSGGVASNSYIKSRLREIASNYKMKLLFPPPELCTDNGAMIAWAGIERLNLGLSTPLNIKAKARWALNELEKAQEI